MKYNKSEIMKDAWNIRRAKNVSMSEALKEAWANAKAPKKSYIEVLEEMGATRWEKYGRKRLYIKRAVKELIGLEVSYYKSGNVSSATMNGDRISNSRARGILYAADSAYIDLVTGNLVTSSYEIAEKVNELKERCA